MSDIQTRIKYEKKVSVEIEIDDNALHGNYSPFKRTDYHEDGSKTKYYGLEMNEGAYKLLLQLMEQK